MTWSSDVSVTAAGWTICASDPGAAPPPPPSTPPPVCENQKGDDWCGRKANTNKCNKDVFRNKCKLTCIEFGHPCNAGTFAEMSLEASPAPEIEEQDAADEHEVDAAEDGGLGGLGTAALIGIVVGGVVF